MEQNFNITITQDTTTEDVETFIKQNCTNEGVKLTPMFAFETVKFTEGVGELNYIPYNGKVFVEEIQKVISVHDGNKIYATNEIKEVNVVYSRIVLANVFKLSATDLSRSMNITDNHKLDIRNLRNTMCIVNK